MESDDSKYSKHPEVAADLIRLMTSATAQKASRHRIWATLPTRPALYVDKELINKVPLLEKMLPQLGQCRRATIYAAER